MFYFKDDKQLSVYFSDGSIGIWEISDTETAQVEEACKKNNWLKVKHLHNKAQTILNNYVTIKDNKLIINVKNSDETLEMNLKDSDSTTMSIINKSRLRTNVYHHERFYIEIDKTGNSIFIYD